MSVTDKTHEGIGKKKQWGNEIWEETVRRHQNNTLRALLYPEPAVIVRQPTLAELWLATKDQDSSDEDNPAQEAAGPETATDVTEAREEEAKATVVEHVERIEEESMCRDLVIRNNLIFLPWSDTLYSDNHKLFSLVQEYVESFTEESTRTFDMTTWPSDARMYVQECVWFFEALAARGWTPNNLRSPRDRNIRVAAGDVHPAFSDPGNLVLDQVIHILRLWRFVSSARIDALLRVAPQPYGDPGNMSASGPINLRGNVIEALLHDLSNMARDYEPKGSKGSGSGDRHVPVQPRAHSSG